MRAPATPLRLLSYLAPSIPEGLFELVASAIEAKTGTAVALDFETSVSGPTPETDPFVSGRADLAFVCGPSYARLRAGGAPVDILPAAAVFEDPRNGGRPVYFSDVIVARDHPARSLADLRGTTWTYNDRESLSGWFRMLGRLVELGLGAPESFFSRVYASGAHVNSIAFVAGGQATVSAVDSNALRFAVRRNPSLDRQLRLLESWGPSPVQPILVRSSLDPDIKASARETLLGLGEDPAWAPRLLEFGVRGFTSVDEASYLQMREVRDTGYTS
jgi:phosphonate transport system substrate-binding protein